MAAGVVGAVVFAVTVGCFIGCFEAEGAAAGEDISFLDYCSASKLRLFWSHVEKKA